MTKPLVSIIIPTYNRAHIIGETLDSVLAQTYKNWECIVVDDGSTDGTDEVLAAFMIKDSRFEYFQRTEDYFKGANSCRHIGFLKSKGKYINWFDSDDLMHKNHLDEKVKKIEKGGYDFVVCEVARFRYECFSDLITVKYDYSGNLVVNQFVGKLTLFTPGPMWNINFLKKNELFYKPNKKENRDTVLNDWVFGIKALMKTDNYAFIKRPLIYYRFHDQSIYSDRVSGNSKKFQDEFVIRKSIYSDFNQNFGSNEEVENYYLERNIKILRGLMVSGGNVLPVLSEILKSSHFSFLSKCKLLILYISSKLFNRGYDRMKYL